MKLSRLRFLFLSFFFIIFLTNAVVVAWIVFLSSQAPHVALSQPTPISNTDLCPSETIVYTFTVEVDKATSVDLSYTVAEDDEIAGTGARLEQFIVNSPTTIVLTRQFSLPPYFPDVADSTHPWEAGKYELRIQARTTGSSRIEDSLVVPFSIREDCQSD